VTRFFVYGLLTLGLLSLAADWTLPGYWFVGLILLILTPLNLFLVKRKFIPTLSLVLVLTVLLAAVGLWCGIDLSLALLAVFCALAAWDLDSFSRRLSFASAEDNPASIERRHLLRLGLVLLLGAGLSYLSLSIHFESSFERAVVLVIFAFTGIGALVNWLRNRESYNARG
jgi:hypothetical protein